MLHPPGWVFMQVFHALPCLHTIALTVGAAAAPNTHSPSILPTEIVELTGWSLLLICNPIAPVEHKQVHVRQSHNSHMTVTWQSHGYHMTITSSTAPPHPLTSCPSPSCWLPTWSLNEECSILKKYPLPPVVLTLLFSSTDAQTHIHTD